ncbi:MAG: NADH-quinone oxidoreductase subunit NuoE [Ignavibacteria bacterium]|nr:NADH-quinone oxidoreductase subunit NuoE [Ignavibacteria bacterium]MBI3765227.1 NADH-quinone oxidoreductase subunit NuoE [Ignavibacteriales bacterium]
MLSHDNLEKFEQLKTQFPSMKSLTLPVLWMIQEQHGWISEDAMKYVADLLGLPLRHVYGVVTFYTMFNRKPVGKYHMQVCTNISCQLVGAEKISDHVCRRLNIKLGETTPDKKFTVIEVECLGSCGTAPMMQINDDYLEHLTIQKVDALIEELK